MRKRLTRFPSRVSGANPRKAPIIPRSRSTGTTLVLPRIRCGAQQMQRYVWHVADHPAVVFLWGDVKDRSRREVNDSAVVERSRSMAGEHGSEVLHGAPTCADARPHVHRPLPAGLICRPAEGLVGDGYELQSAPVEFSDLVGRLEARKDRVHAAGILSR